MKKLLLLIFTLNILHASGQIDIADHHKSLALYESALNEMQQGHYEPAIGKLIQAINLDSMQRSYYINLYEACLASENYMQVISYLQKATRIFQEDDELFYYMGNIFQKTDNTDQAIICYDSAIVYSKINGEDYPIVYAYYLNRGNCLMKKKKFKMATADYNEAIRLNDSDGACYANRGIALYQQGKKEDACADWEKAVTFGQSVASQYINKYCNNK